MLEFINEKKKKQTHDPKQMYKALKSQNAVNSITKNNTTHFPCSRRIWLADFVTTCLGLRRIPAAAGPSVLTPPSTLDFKRIPDPDSSLFISISSAGDTGSHLVTMRYLQQKVNQTTQISLKAGIWSDMCNKIVTYLSDLLGITLTV